jgi:hypothetical protein
MNMTMNHVNNHENDLDYVHDNEHKHEREQDHEHTHAHGCEHIMDSTVIRNIANNDSGKEHEKMIVLEDALKHTSTTP